MAKGPGQVRRRLVGGPDRQSRRVAPVVRHRPLPSQSMARAKVAANTHLLRAISYTKYSIKFITRSYLVSLQTKKTAIEA